MSSINGPYSELISFKENYITVTNPSDPIEIDPINSPSSGDDLFVPTAFTPNGDTFNDKLVVHGKSETIDMVKVCRIYDRWGELMYETFDMTAGWDGRYEGELVEDGVYIWSLSFGDTLNDERIYRKGHVTVLK